MTSSQDQQKDNQRVMKMVRADTEAFMEAHEMGVTRPQDMLRNDTAEELGVYLEGLGEEYRDLSVKEFIDREWDIELPHGQHDMSDMPLYSEVGKACMELARHIDGAAPHCLDYQGELYRVAIRQMQCFAYS
jgi:hypothetical protein